MLARRQDFITGPLSLARDTPERFGIGFTPRDGSYLSVRWPGVAHRFAGDLAAMLDQASAWARPQPQNVSFHDFDDGAAARPGGYSGVLHWSGRAPN